MLHKKQTRLNLELSQRSQDPPPYFEPARGTFDINIFFILFFTHGPHTWNRGSLDGHFLLLLILLLLHQ